MISRLSFLHGTSVIFALLAGAFGGIYHSVPGSSAQEPPATQLTLSAQALNAVLSAGMTVRQSMGIIAVYADGQLCTIVDVRSGSGDVVVTLGLPGQPVACRSAGATLSFLDGLHNQLSRTLTLGVDSHLNDFTPMAPGTGAAIIVVPRESLATENDNGTVGNWLGELTAKVGGVECTTADVSAASRDVALPIGLPGQPSECSTPGGEIRVVDMRGFILAESFVFEPGTKVILSNLAPLPPHQQPPLPAGTSQPSGSTPPRAQSPSIQPPSTGTGGLR